MTIMFTDTSFALLRNRPTRIVVFVVVLSMLLWPLLALGQVPTATGTASNASSSAPTAPQEAPAPPPQPTKTEFQTTLEVTASRIRDLLGEKLDPAVDPKTLFDVALDDERLIGIEKERLSLLLREPEAGVLGDAGVDPAPARNGKKADKSAAKSLGKKTNEGKDSAKGNAETAVSGAGAASATVAPASIAAPASTTKPSPASWTEGELAARLELDGARLSFYELSRDRRDALLASHQTRQAEDRRAQTDAKVDQAEQRAADAQRRQEEALEAARTARTEALRVVAEEHARLLGIAREHAELESRFVKERSQLQERQEAVIGWQRRVREMVASVSAGQATTDAVDSLYRGLRKDLRRTRDDLSRALSRLHAESIVQEAGDDRLLNLPEGVPAEKPRAQRRIVSVEATRLRGVESELRRDTADAEFEQALALNRARLALYPYLSSEMRSEVSGFGPYGLEQAQAELRQVSLIAR